MKKYLKYIITASIFTAQSLFAQSTTNAEGMDMSAYATWMASGFLIFLFIMIAIFLLKADNVQNEESVTEQQSTIVYSKIKFAPGNSLLLLPGISIDLQRVGYLLASALIMFSTILLLLIIQK